VEVGLDGSSGDSKYSIIVDEKTPGQVYTLRLQWQHGDLGGWLHFARSLKEALGGKPRK
jgi:hypothetical protein